MRGRLAALGILSIILAPPFARADPITTTFTVTATTGPLAGITSSGSFVFDSSIIVPGGSDVAAGSLSSLTFTWDGIAYTEATANTGGLVWDSDGTLVSAVLGNNCGVGFCSIRTASNDWAVSIPVGFQYGVPGASGVNAFQGTVTYRTPGQNVPEPASVVLLGGGLIAALSRYRQRNTRTSR
jgi:PEP-CTERM motif